jgi:hypothetical protein
MHLPKFTAEASLGAKSQHYALASRVSAQSGVILPQFCFRSSDGSYTTCVTCYDIDGDGLPDWCDSRIFRAYTAV